MRNKILFLTGHRKSGTSLLNGIFDGHEDFLVYPNDISILYAYYPFFTSKKFSFIKKKKRLLKVISKSIDYKKKNIFFDKEKFLKKFTSKINIKNIDNINLILKILINSFIFSTKQKKFKYVVIKETSCSLLAENFFKYFKNLRMIQIVRDPRDNYGSLVDGEKYYKRIGENRKELLASLINRSSIDFEYSILNKMKFKNFYLVIRFEDLTKHTKGTILKMCKFLDVKYHKNFMTPSIFSKLYQGNNFKKLKFNKISSVNVNKWRKRIKKSEAEIIEFYLRKYLVFYKYKFNKKNKSDSILEFYNWYNHKYFYNDSFI